MTLSMTIVLSSEAWSPAPLAGDARTLVDSLSVELAGEKIDLPSFPDVAMRVRKALTSEEVGIEDAVKIVSAEPALAARLMQLSNSATLNPGGTAPQQPSCRNGAHRPQHGLQRDHCLRDVTVAPCRNVQGHRAPVSENSGTKPHTWRP